MPVLSVFFEEDPVESHFIFLGTFHYTDKVRMNKLIDAYLIMRELEWAKNRLKFVHHYIGSMIPEGERL